MKSLLTILAALLPFAAHAADLTVLTSGAYRATLVALSPAIERETGYHLVITNETAGGVAAKLRAGASVDLVILPPANAASLGPLLGPARPLAKVGIGIAVKQGTPHPDIATVEAVRTTVLAARAPAWIDPAAGGSSGIAMARIFESWGIAQTLAPKAVLVNGGLVTDKLGDGTADLAFQQLSELTGHPGIDVVGPLPPAIQSYTTYAGAIPANSTHQAEAATILDHLATAGEAATLAAHGMEPP